jgi:hypothetical protein
MEVLLGVVAFTLIVLGAVAVISLGLHKILGSKLANTLSLILAWLSLAWAILLPLAIAFSRMSDAALPALLITAFWVLPIAIWYSGGGTARQLWS